MLPGGSRTICIIYTAHVSWVGSVLDRSRTTAGEELDNLERFLTDDLDRDLIPCQQPLPHLFSLRAKEKLGQLLNRWRQLQPDRFAKIEAVQSSSLLRRHFSRSVSQPSSCTLAKGYAPKVIESG